MAAPEWLGYLETSGFIGMIGAIIYNRVMTYRAIDRRTSSLEASFSQYQKDITIYLRTCETCRGEVRHHHEDEAERHVTGSMRDQISALVGDVADIKRFLMEHK